MRAARAAAAEQFFRLPRWRIAPKGELRSEPQSHRPTIRKDRKEAGRWRAGLMFSTLFLLGDLGGVLAGRLGGCTWGQELAAYYSQAEHFAHWTQVFADLYSGAFLQCTIVFLCGFSALGPGLIGLFLAGKGVMLGLCAAGVYSNGGVHGLVVYWLLTCLSDLILLVLLLWLALSAQALGVTLLHALHGQAPHTRRAPVSMLQRLVLSYLAALLIGAAGCLVGAGSAVLFAGVLL